MASLDCRAIGLAERGQLAVAQLPVFEVEHGIDDAAMEMNALIERITEAMDETDDAETGVLACIRTTFDQRLANHLQQDMQHRTRRHRIGLEKVAQPFRQRQDPLAYRQRREDMMNSRST